MKIRAVLITLSLLSIVACEAPLNLDNVSAENAKDITRFDLFQSVAHYDERVAVVSSTGAVILSDDNGVSWQRQVLDDRPSLIDVTACENGDIFALDTEKRVWQLKTNDESQASPAIDSYGRTLSIHCAPGDRLWVSASEALLYRREPGSDQWQEFALEEQLAAVGGSGGEVAADDPYAGEFEDDWTPPPQFTNIHFLDARNGFVAGEFGTVIATNDGGDSWESRASVPNDFYPMASAFLDANYAWVGGLDGVVWMTSDGGKSWQRQETITSAPIYGLYAGETGVFAVGGGAKLVEYLDGEWRSVANAPQVLAFLRGVDVLADGTLLVAGSGGTLERIAILRTGDAIASASIGGQPDAGR